MGLGAAWVDDELGAQAASKHAKLTVNPLSHARITSPFFEGRFDRQRSKAHELELNHVGPTKCVRHRTLSCCRFRGRPAANMFASVQDYPLWRKAVWNASIGVGVVGSLLIAHLCRKADVLMAWD